MAGNIDLDTMKRAHALHKSGRHDEALRIYTLLPPDTLDEATILCMRYVYTCSWSVLFVTAIYL